MIVKWLRHSNETITSAAILIGAASLLSRLLGVLRDRVLAGEFGAGVELDMYYAAFRIPDLIYNLVVLGALSAGFIPIFTKLIDRKKEAWELASITVNALVIVLLLLTGVLYFFAPWLTKVVAPGFSIDQQQVTTSLTRIMLFSPLLLGLSAVVGGVLQSFKNFFIYSLAPIFYNIGIIIGALYFVPVWGIYGLAWGVVVGALFHLLIQLPTLFAIGFRYSPSFNLANRGFLRLVKLMGPRTVALVINQFNLVIITIFASGLAIGSLTIFNLASNLQSFPLGVLGVSLAVAAFPTLSAASEQKEKFIAILNQTARHILFLIIPTSALLIVLRAQVVRIVLGAGKFSWADTVLTLNTLEFFAISLFAQALIVLLIRGFYALEDSNTPLVAAVVGLITNILFAVMLVETWGVLGLALAFSLSSIINMLILGLMLHARLGSLRLRLLRTSVLKIITATFVLTIVAQSVKYITADYFGTATFYGIFLQGLLAGTAGLVSYVVVSYLVRSPELLELRIPLLHRRKKISAVVPHEVVAND